MTIDDKQSDRQGVSLSEAFMAGLAWMRANPDSPIQEWKEAAEEFSRASSSRARAEGVPVSKPQPMSVWDQLDEHQGTEFETYDFSSGFARIMKRSEFDKEYGYQLRAQLEQAREVRRLNRSQCDATFGPIEDGPHD